MNFFTFIFHLFILQFLQIFISQGLHLWYVPFFPPKTIHDLMFSQGFMENQSFSTKAKAKRGLETSTSYSNPLNTF